MVDLFAFDLLLMPINNNHWSMNMRNQTELYDSLGRKDWNCYQVLTAYLRKEHQGKQKCPLTPEVKWECQYVENLPQQCNSHDCGMFVCLYAECLARGTPFNFSARDIQRLQYRIAFEILSGKLMGPLTLTATSSKDKRVHYLGEPRCRLQPARMCPCWLREFCYAKKFVDAFSADSTLFRLVYVGR